jgi:hypothetical protein
MQETFSAISGVEFGKSLEFVVHLGWFARSSEVETSPIGKSARDPSTSPGMTRRGLEQLIAHRANARLDRLLFFQQVKLAAAEPDRTVLAPERQRLEDETK